MTLRVRLLNVGHRELETVHVYITACQAIHFVQNSWRFEQAIMLMVVAPLTLQPRQRPVVAALLQRVLRLQRVMSADPRPGR
jgi:hypothetical protein